MIIWCKEHPPTGDGKEAASISFDRKYACKLENDILSYIRTRNKIACWWVDQSCWNSKLMIENPVKVEIKRASYNNFPKDSRNLIHSIYKYIYTMEKELPDQTDCTS